MKKRIYSILLMGLLIGLLSDAQAEKVFLECKVSTQSQDQDGRSYRVARETVSISFDERKGTLSHDATIGKGCSSDEHTKNVKCDCRISDEIISCDTEGQEKYANISVTMWFTVHRFTGRFTAFRVVKNHEKNTGMVYEYEGACEKFTSNKF